MAWHLEVLAPKQRRVLAQIGPVLTQRGFRLAGGTAVALHLGHRRSVDFDWFTTEGLDDPQEVGVNLKEEGVPFVIDQTGQGALHGFVQGVNVSLLRHRYPWLASAPRARGGIRIASRADLAAMKLNAVAQRGAKKDFCDIYALGKRAFSLRRMLTLYRKKYAVENTAHLLCSLAYFDDAERERMPRLLWDVTWRDMKATILRWLKSMTRL